MLHNNWCILWLRNKYYQVRLKATQAVYFVMGRQALEKHFLWRVHSLILNIGASFPEHFQLSINK